MRSLIIAIAVAIAAAAGGTLVPLHPAIAQTAAKDIPVVVGTLDVQTILAKSKAGQSLETAVLAKRKALLAETQKTEQGLRARRQQLEQQRSSLPPADYQAQVAQLEKEFEAFRKSASAKSKELESAQRKGLKQIFDTLDVVVKSIAEKRGLTLVINRSLVVLAAEAWDITADVVKALDAKLPKVTI